MSDRLGNRPDLLIVGYPAPYHVGAHLQRAAQALNLDNQLCDVTAAFAAPWPVVRFNWRLRGHRPPRLASFSRMVVQACDRLRPRWLLTVGLAPLTADSLNAIRQLGIQCLNYLTDDPWNPAHAAPWFTAGLPHYDRVYSPRRANLDDLRRLGCRQVAYLPFAYAPEIHYPELPGPAEQARLACEVLFYGGADRDRLPYIAALLQAGISVHLYGSYWGRYPQFRACFQGQADPPTLRQAVSAARVTLCLVRRANRDGHVMRTFEAPAMGACLLVEDTAEQRAILGNDGEAVLYFSSLDEMIHRTRWLLTHVTEGAQLRVAAHERITRAGHTYRDRLSEMLDIRSAEK